jgi:hypothetical protein
MEKSIETIWKEGFLEDDALIAPTLNNLYSKKSSHIIDKFKKMFKINLVAIVASSFIVLVMSFIAQIPVMGVMFFIILIAIVIVNKKLLRSLEKIDKNRSSYEYLRAFDDWMKAQLTVNRKLARYYYPLFFLSVVLGFYFSPEGLINDILNNPNEIYMINGVPVFWLTGILFITFLLGLFGPRIYNLDVKIVYGRVFNKLDELMTDIEELRR